MSGILRRCVGHWRDQDRRRHRGRGRAGYWLAAKAQTKQERGFEDAAQSECARCSPSRLPGERLAVWRASELAVPAPWIPQAAGSATWISFRPGETRISPERCRKHVRRVRRPSKTMPTPTLLGEARWGASKDKSRLIYVTVGTGIGSGMVFDGNLYRGANGAHPEVAHHGDRSLRPSSATAERAAVGRLWPAGRQWLPGPTPEDAKLAAVEGPELDGLTNLPACRKMETVWRPKPWTREGVLPRRRHRESGLALRPQRDPYWAEE